jgi:hypothetical protein
MPVGVVVLDGTNIDGRGTDTEANRAAQSAIVDQYITEAQEILLPTGICLIYEGIWHEPVDLSAPTGGVNPDGSLEMATATIDFDVESDEGTHNEIEARVELSNMSSKAKELANSPPPPPLTLFWPAPGRGYIIVFANYLYPNSLVRGKSGDDPNTPVNFIQANSFTGPGTSPFQMGKNIAHEFTHLFAREEDHHPEPGNILYEIAGTEWEPEQIEAVRAGAMQRADFSEHDTWQDDTGDASQDYLDLNRGYLFIPDAGENLEFTISLLGLFPELPVEASVEAYLDTDNDVSTGVGIHGFLGIDKIVRLSLNGVFPFAGSSSAQVADVASGLVSQLPPPDVRRSRLWTLYREDAIAPGPTSEPDHDVIRQLVSLTELAPLSEEIPVGLMTTNLATGETDQVSLVLDLSEAILPPTALCQDVSVTADTQCSADADIDAGSFAAEGGPVSLSQDPAGPYGQGDTVVELTVTDSLGVSASCEATVTVVDVTEPEIQCNAPATIVPPDGLDEDEPMAEPVSFTATASDVCDASVAATILDFDCYAIKGKGRQIDKTDSCVVEYSEDTIIILNGGGIGTEIVWAVEATDDAGNVETTTCGVQTVKK